MEASSRPIYFTRLELENIRAFGERQCLDLCDNQGHPAQWTLILGENGVGKTTLLECLTRMRPVFNEEPDDKDDISPNKIEPELYQEEDNNILASYARKGGNLTAEINAELVDGAVLGGSGRRKTYRITTSIKIVRKGEDIVEVKPGGLFSEGHKFPKPLVLAYGAGRHMGIANLEKVDLRNSTDSLFNGAIELFDAEETLNQLDHLKLKRRAHAATRLASLKEALAAILPHIENPRDIDIRGPRLPGGKAEDGGIWVRTPFGVVPMRRLSLGYQTMMGWVADIAWRLINHYPASANPLTEPAVVIVDEIDLHLHPYWQRHIRRDLTRYFPAVQFIATAHSPLMAQDALSTNLAVVRSCEGQAHVFSDPAVVSSWRLDQVLTSELFGLESARPPEVESKMRRRIALAQKRAPTAAERKELAELDTFVKDLPTAENSADQSALDVIRSAAMLLKKRSETT